MEIHALLLDLMIVLLSARVLAEVAARLGAPPVIGELTAGVLLGPSLLGWVDASGPMVLLAEIGIILLLFEVGLETDVSLLLRTGAKSVTVAAAGLVVPFVLAFGLAYWAFDRTLLTALFVGGTLTATSIGVTMRVLSDLGRHQSREGRVVLGAAVLDDIMGVVLLAVLYEFSIGGGVNLTNAGKVLLFVGVFFLMAPVAAKAISAVIDRFDAVSPIPGLIPTTILSLVLLFAWLAHVVGAPQLLGGFAAGLALSRRFFLPFGLAIRTRPAFAARIEEQMKPVIHLFTPLFFVTVGLSVNLRLVDWGSPFIWAVSLSLVVVAVVSKMVGAFLIRETTFLKVVIGLAMVPRGEVGLVFAELGRTSGILGNEMYAALVLVIAFTTLLPPFGLKALYRRWGPPPEDGGEEGDEAGARPP
jgi:Kef-type K+ transport system membrane component KefB